MHEKGLANMYSEEKNLSVKAFTAIFLSFFRLAASCAWVKNAFNYVHTKKRKRWILEEEKETRKKQTTK